MTAAYKQAMLQAFCIPVSRSEDADMSSTHLKFEAEPPDPVQGWEQWTRDIADLILGCESEEAVGRVHETYRAMLRAASKRPPDLYAAIGRAIGDRKQVLGKSAPLGVESKLANGIAKRDVRTHA